MTTVKPVVAKLNRFLKRDDLIHEVIKINPKFSVTSKTTKALLIEELQKYYTSVVQLDAVANQYDPKFVSIPKPIQVVTQPVKTMMKANQPTQPQPVLTYNAKLILPAQPVVIQNALQKSEHLRSSYQIISVTLANKRCTVFEAIRRKNSPPIQVPEDMFATLYILEKGAFVLKGNGFVSVVGNTNLVITDANQQTMVLWNQALLVGDELSFQVEKDGLQNKILFENETTKEQRAISFRSREACTYIMDSIRALYDVNKRAIKEVVFSPQYTEEEFLNEVEMLKLCQCSERTSWARCRVLHEYESFLSDDHTTGYLITPLLRGSLAVEMPIYEEEFTITQPNTPLAADQLHQCEVFTLFARECFTLIHKLHDQFGICHGSPLPDNWLLDGEFDALILADFRLSGTIDDWSRITDLYCVIYSMATLLDLAMRCMNRYPSSPVFDSNAPLFPKLIATRNLLLSTTTNDPITHELTNLVEILVHEANSLSDFASRIPLSELQSNANFSLKNNTLRIAVDNQIIGLLVVPK